MASKHLQKTSMKLENGMAKPNPRLQRRAPQPLALEQRFMFDGAAAVDAAHTVLDAKLAAPTPPVATVQDTAVAAPQEKITAASATSILDHAIASAPGVAKEILFIDPTVADYQKLLADVRPGVEVHILNTTQDPWQQMTEVIARQQDISAIHIVSHGANGEILFGDHAYRVADLQAESDYLASWHTHLTSGAELLLYGCDIGNGQAGTTLVNTLAKMTSTDVAASSDGTGGASQGGNWVLETSSAPIETRIAFTDAVLGDYTQLLVGTPQTLVVTTGTNVDSTAATTGLVGAGKLITFDAVTLTMGATSNGMLVTGYDVDYGMKDSSGNPYPVGNAASEWDGVYIKLANAADTPANWKFIGYLNGLNNTWITTTGFDVTSQMTALGISVGQSAAYNVRVVPDDNGTQTQANNGGRWVVGASKLQFIIDGGSSHTATLGTPTETAAAVSVVVTPTNTATYTVVFNLVDSTGHVVAGYNTTTPMTANTPMTISGSLQANTTLYSSTAFSNVPSGTYTLQVSVLDSNGVQQDAKSVSETITSSGGGGTGTTTVLNSSKSSPNYTIITGNTSWTTVTPADVQHQATSDTTPTITGWVYGNSTSSARTVDVYVDGVKVGSTTSTTGSANYNSTYHGYAWTYTLSSAISLGTHSFTAQRNGTGYVASNPYSLTIDGPTTPVITGLTAYIGSSAGDIAHTATASGTPTLTGTSTPYSTLYIYDTIAGVTTLLGATSANSAGAWAYSIPSNSALANGSYTFKATDQSFGLTSGNYSLDIDSTAPTVTVSNVHISNDTGSSASDFVTAAQQQNVTATLSTPLTNGQQLMGSLDGGLTWTNVTSSVSGTSVIWGSQLLRSGYADPSQYTPWAIQFKVSDGGTPAQYGPLASIDYRYVGNIADPTITRTGWATASTPALYGTADPSSIVTISNGSTVLGTATPDSSGNWSFTPGTPFADGSYTLTVTAADPYSGATSAHSASINLTIDHTLPVITGIHISSDTGGSTSDFITSTAGQTITATLSQALNTTNNPQTLWGSVDGGTTWTQISQTGTSINWTGQTLLAGSNSIEFQARSATAQGAVAVQNYILDTTAPVLVSSGNAATYDSNASEVVLVFNELGSGLDPSFVPATSAFAVNAGASVTAVTIDAVNNKVILTVTGTVTSVTYTKPGTNMLRDVAGNQVATFSKTGLTDIAGDTTAPSAPTLALKADAGISDTGSSTSDNKTANPTPVVRVSLPGTGSAAPVAGDIVDVYSNGISVGQAILSATNVTNKYVDVTVANLGSDGSKSITATETDAAGNISGTSTPLAITLDSTAPTVNTMAVNGSTLVLYVNEFGTGLTSATPATTDFVVTRTNGSGTTTDAVSSVVVDTVAQTVTLTLSSAITSADSVTLSYTRGTNKLQDTAGNLLANLVNQTVINNSPDLTPPTAPSLSLNAVSDSGTYNNDAITKVTTPSIRVTLNGTGATRPVIGDTLNLYLGGTPFGSATQLSGADIVNGYVDIVLPNLGTDGAKSLTATVTDSSANISGVSSPLVIQLDTQVAAPGVALLNDTFGASGTGSDLITSDSRLDVTGTEPGALIEYSANGTSGWSTTAPSPSQGGNTVYVRQTDVASNVSTATSFTFTYDNIAPAAPTVDAQSTTSTAPTITGTAGLGSGEILTVTVNGATYSVTPDGSGHWSLDLAIDTPTSGSLGALSAGHTYAVTATVTDEAGNHTDDATTNELRITAIGNTAPVLGGGSPTDAYVEQGSPIIIDSTVTVSDADNPPSFDGGYILVSVATPGTADQLSVSAGNGISASGSDVSYNGTIIGSVVSSGINGTDLKIDLNANATVAATQALMQNLAYANTSDAPVASRSISYTLNDGLGGEAIKTATVNITPVNDPPVLDAGKSPILSTISEDLPAPSNGSTLGSTLVSALVDNGGPLNNFSDPDGNLPGIAVTGVSSHGTLWYSTDAGAHWTQATSVDANHALLLYADANTRLYFQPTANFNGTLSDAITIKAWDRNGAANGASGIDTSGALSLGAAGTLGSLGNVRGIAANGNYVYVGDAGAGLRIIDVSTPGSPALVKTVDSAGFEGNITIDGHYAYVSAWTGMAVIDIANPASAAVTTYMTGIGSVSDVAIQGNYAYVADYSGSGTTGNLRVVDISNPAVPSLVATLSLGGGPRDLTIVGNHAYVANASNGLQIIDISDPLNPVLTGTLAGAAYGIEVSGNYAYLCVGNPGLEVVNITNPAAPSYVTTISTGGGTYGVSIDGQVAYVASSGAGLVAVNIADPSHPAIAASFNTAGSSWSSALVNGYAYVADGSAMQVLTRSALPTDVLSTASDTVALTITAVNDAPVASGSNVSLAAIAEDTGNPPGASVSSLFATSFSDATDQVSGGSSANTFAGIAITTYTADTSKGIWQYSSDGSTWSDLASVSASNLAVTLQASDLLRFVPSADWNGSAPSLTVSLIDSSLSVSTGSTVDASTRGGTTAYSQATILLDHSVTAVNDPPVNTALPVITGTQLPGHQLTVSSGTWNDSKDGGTSTITYTYQWYLADDASGTNAAAIGSASASTYTPVATDAGKYLGVIVTATDNGVGTPATQSSTGATAWTLVNFPTPAQTVTISSIVDDVAPVTAVVANGASSNDTAPDLAGTLGSGLNPGDVLAIYRDGVKIGNASVTGNNWTYHDSGLADATYSYTARVENGALQGPASSAYGLTVDTVAPVPTISLNSVTADNVVNASEAAGNVSITGSVGGEFNTGDTVTLTINGATYTGSVAANGGFSINVTGANLVADSNLTIDASIATTDAAGNPGSASTTKAYLVDTVAPAAPTVDAQITAASAPILTGSALTGSGETLSISVSGATYAVTPDNTGHWQLDLLVAVPTSGTFSPLVQGQTYSVVATITDAAGNATPDATANEIVVVPGPSQQIDIIGMTKDTGVLASDFITADGSAGRSVTGTLSGPLGTNEVVEVSFDGGASWHAATTSGTNWSATDNTLHAADWTIQARVTNTVAHVSGNVASQAVVLDTAAPQTPSVAPLSSTSPQPVISGTFDSADAAGGLTVTLDGVTYVLGRDAALTASGNTWSLDLAATNQKLGPATYDVTVTATDRAGNQSADTSHGELIIAQVPLPPLVVLPVVTTPPAEILPLPVAPQAEIIAPQTTAQVVLAVDTRQDDAAQARQIDNVLTAPGKNATRIPVMPSEQAALFRYHGVPDQYFEVDAKLQFRLPSDAFVHTRENAVVQIQVERADGGPLPGWLRFDATTGVFEGKVPDDAPDFIEVRVTARDNEGREASTIFRIKLLHGEKAKPAGRASLSEQIRLAAAPGHLGLLGEIERTARMAGKRAA